MLRGLLQLQVLVLIFFNISCDQTKNSSTNSSEPFAIVNGHSFTNPEDNLGTYTVRIRTTFINPYNTTELKVSNCTGVLVLEHYVLTAAHCVSFEKIISAEIIFPLLNKVETFRPRQVTISSGYTDIDLKRDYDKLQDVAFVRLQSIPQMPYQSLALFDLSKSLPHQFSFKALGYGQQHGIILNKSVQTFDLKYVTLEASYFNAKIPYFEVDQRQKGICFGDSGGPAIVQFENKNYLIGIATDVLFNPTRIFEPDYDRCLEKSVYANILYFKDWIEKETQGLTRTKQ